MLRAELPPSMVKITLGPWPRKFSTADSSVDVLLKGHHCKRTQYIVNTRANRTTDADINRKVDNILPLKARRDHANLAARP